ncbi:carbohydrate-binding module family 18 protein [Apiospora rasikravindrae]|uniref:Carbohydrate-binding module family 18 protein n=1 Tax=Apiospora rasikravindrae TaxID=990691 RepID=A0ABR1RS17_9PEZI
MQFLLPILLLLSSPAAAAVRCRYNATAPAPVSYYSCTAMAEKYGISRELFMDLNPLLDPDCSSIEAGRGYCVAGAVLDATPRRRLRPGPSRDVSRLRGRPVLRLAHLDLRQHARSLPDGDLLLRAVRGTRSGRLLAGRILRSGNRDGRCGTGDGFCDAASCYNGNCIVIPPPPIDDPDGLPIWETGNTTDGLCGPTGRDQVCNVFFGPCCASTGKCGSDAEFCEAGCLRGYGKCFGDTEDPTEPGGTSPDGTCGGANGFLCRGSPFGDCCSSSGFCGNTTGHCEAGCQPDFGTCAGAANLSPDGTCGGANGYTCAGSTFGDCCSSGGWCGSGADYCTAGCQAAFGACDEGAGDISTDGRCGPRDGGNKTCTGSAFGRCCSGGGYCGNSDAHCSDGCQSAFGTC